MVRARAGAETPIIYFSTGTTGMLPLVRQVGTDVVGIDCFGESAPAGALFKHFGFTPENVADTVQAVLQR